MPRFKTYQTSDWNVYTSQAGANAFILGTSVLGNSVLSSSTFSLTALNNVHHISIREGGLPTYSMFFNVTPATATVTLRLKDFQINDAYKFLVNSPLKITLDNANTNGSSTYDLETVYFNGFIDNVDVSVDPNADFTLVNIQATSKRSKNLNNLLSITKNTSSLKSDLIYAAYPPPEDSVTSVYPTHPKDLVIAPGKYHYASTTTEVKSLGEFLREFTESEIYFACDTYKLREGFAASLGGSNYAYSQDPEHTIFISSLTTPNYGNQNGGWIEEELYEIEFGWDGVDSPTAVDLSQYENSSIVYQSSPTSATGIGANIYTNQPDVKDLSELTAVGQAALTSTRRFVPRRISVQMARNGDYMTYLGETFSGTKAGGIGGTKTTTTYFYPGNPVNLGDAVNLVLPSYTSTNTYMIVCGRNHEIDADNWFISYDLWKGI